MRASGEGKPGDLPISPTGASIGSQALSGVTWVGSTKAIRHGLQYLLHIILARILFPSDFGVFGIVLIFIELGVLLNELGLSTALIQRKQLDREDTDTAFWGILGVSLGMFILLLAVAGPVAAFFAEPVLRDLIPIGGSAFVFSSLGTVPVALLSREMRFRRLLLPEVGGVLVGNGVAIALALTAGGAKSLVWGHAVTAGTISVLALWSARWSPRLSFEWLRMKSLFSFGGYVMGRRLIDYAGASFVYVLIAKVLGESVAGLYLLILRPTILPQYAFGSVLGRVGLSAFSRVQDEDERINRGFLLMTRYTVLLAFPMLCLLGTLAPEFLGAIYGARWIAGAGPLAVLAIMGLANVAVSQPGTVWMAKGRASLTFYWAILMAFTVAAAALAGILWGFLAVCIALAARSVVLFPVPAFITQRITGISPREYFRVLLPYFAASGILIVVVVALNRLPFVPWPEDRRFFFPPQLFRLVILSGVGLTVYAFAVQRLRPETWEEITHLLKRLKTGGKESTEQ